MEQNNANFKMGLMTGITVISVLGFIIMSFAYFNKGNSTDKAALNNLPSANQPTANAPSPTPTQANAPNPVVDINEKSTDHVRGKADAAVTIIEYSDFQCPYCTRFHDTMTQVMEKYPNDVKWIYRHFPLDSIHPQARGAAEAAECAGDQGKFWEYADRLYANQASFSASYYPELAKELNLNVSQFEACLESDKHLTRVSADFNEGRQYGVTGTPGNFINGELFKGAVPFAQISQIIESKK